MEAFFLRGPDGARLCIHHPPPGERRVGIVFVHAFAEEMNKSRHVVAQTARRLAAQGFGVLLIDLKGCGDSDGSLADARWADWRTDVGSALEWLRADGYVETWLWGLRLGAALAADVSCAAAAQVQRCVVWQPVSSGRSALTQFLRLRSVNAMMAGGADAPTVGTLRTQSAQGQTVEVAGYALAPGLAADIEALNLERPAPPCPVEWFDVVAKEGDSVSAASARVIAAWQAGGATVQAGVVAAEPFWAANNAVELLQCPSIVAATVKRLSACR